jgi:hypothetical protein
MKKKLTMPSVDPNEIWEAYIAETDREFRSPQGAIAFTVHYLTERAKSDDRRG